MNIIQQIASDPILVKKYLNPIKEEVAFEIPAQYEEQLKALRVLSSSDKAVLVSKVSSPEDYQQQLRLTALLQNSLDRVHEIITNLYFLQMRWHTHMKEATTYVNRVFFEPLNELRDGVRKAVLSSVLSPVEAGVERVDGLIDIGEKIYSHLIATNWNVKEGSTLIREYLTTLKSPGRGGML